MAWIRLTNLAGTGAKLGESLNAEGLGVPVSVPLLPPLIGIVAFGREREVVVVVSSPDLPATATEAGISGMEGNERGRLRGVVVDEPVEDKHECQARRQVAPTSPQMPTRAYHCAKHTNARLPPGAETVARAAATATGISRRISSSTAASDIGMVGGGGGSPSGVFDDSPRSVIAEVAPDREIEMIACLLVVPLAWLQCQWLAAA